LGEASPLVRSHGEKTVSLLDRILLLVTMSAEAARKNAEMHRLWMQFAVIRYGMMQSICRFFESPPL
jgi:hypothetical protein